MAREHEEDLLRRFKRARRYNTTKRKLPWHLDFETYYRLIKQSVCTYCRADLTKDTGSGLDRRDNDKGYSIKNVVPCCGTCNRIKAHFLTVDEMKVAMRAILSLRKRRNGKNKKTQRKKKASRAA